MADPGLSSKELKELKELRIFNPYWAPKIGDMSVIIIWRVPNKCLTLHSGSCWMRSTTGRNVLGRLLPHSQVNRLPGVIPVKVMERQGTLRPAASWISLLEILGPPLHKVNERNVSLTWTRAWAGSDGWQGGNGGEVWNLNDNIMSLLIIW